jgi:hypothetical protein
VLWYEKTDQLQPAKASKQSNNFKLDFTTFTISEVAAPLIGAPNSVSICYMLNPALQVQIALQLKSLEPHA